MYQLECEIPFCSFYCTSWSASVDNPLQLLFDAFGRSGRLSERRHIRD